MKFKLSSHKSKVQAAEYIKNLPDKPMMELEIKKYSRQRSLEANRRHWAIISQIEYWMRRSNEVHDRETWHLYFLAEFLEPVSSVVRGKLLERYSSRKLTSFEFNELDNEIEAWAGNHAITIMDADEWQEFRKAS